MNRAARGLLLLLVPLLAAPAAPAERAFALPVQEFVLANGMRFLIVPRPQATTLAAGWAAAVGSADEEPGRTGVSHLLEHLLFKGSRTVGARDLAREDKLLREQDRLFVEIRQLAAHGGRPARLDKLRQRWEELRTRARAAAFLGEFSLLYSEAGGSQLDAGTFRDLTLYHVTLPPERLELWFWMESDRLLNPVFREFYKEKAVVAEERRLRIGSTPTGAADERLEDLFWRPLPYRWLTLGRPEDLASLDRPTAMEFFHQHYTAPALTAALVGPVDPQEVRALAERYFGRLPSGQPAEEVAAFPAPTLEESFVESSCQCPPQARVLYPTVPFRDPDSYPLQVLAGLLNGRSGRLHRALVLEQRIAFSASAMQHPLRRAGHFAFSAETRGEALPADLVRAWDRELARLVAEPIPEAELERVRNRLAADGLRRLKEPGALMKQLLIYESLGSWREIDEWTGRILGVSEEEVRRAAQRYLTRDRRLVAIYRRPGSEQEPP